MKTKVKMKFKDSQVSFVVDEGYVTSNKLTFFKATVNITLFDQYGNEKKIKIIGVLDKLDFDMLLPNEYQDRLGML